MTGSPVDRLRAAFVENSGDQRLVARCLLLALYRRDITVAEAEPFLRHVFRLADLVSYFEYLAVYLIITGGQSPAREHSSTVPLVQSLYGPIGAWLKQCFVERDLTMPPVNETQAMAFVDWVLGGAEAHLRCLRAREEARLIGEVRRQANDAWRALGGQWVLSPTFSSHVGHFAYAAALMTERDAGEIEAPPITMLRGQPHNAYLQRYFERHTADSAPAGIAYAETISVSKRYTTAAGQRVTMSELFSQAAGRWTGGSAFVEIEPRMQASAEEILAAFGVAPEDKVVTLHVREAGYNQSIASTMRLRDARIDTYGPAIRALVAGGFKVFLLGDRSMVPAPVIDGLIDYPFTEAKCDRMDVYLAARCTFHIGTSSGMSFIPLLFGRPVLFTNFPTLSHCVCTPKTVTLPKVLKTLAGEVVHFESYCRDHADILETSDATLHGLEFADNGPDDLLQAAMMMVDNLDRDTGALDLPEGLFTRVRSLLPRGPRIPDWFLDRHYPIGSR